MMFTFQTCPQIYLKLLFMNYFSAGWTLIPQAIRQFFFCVSGAIFSFDLLNQGIINFLLHISINCYYFIRFFCIVRNYSYRFTISTLRFLVSKSTLIEPCSPGFIVLLLTTAAVQPQEVLTSLIISGWVPLLSNLNVYSTFSPDLTLPKSC